MCRLRNGNILLFDGQHKAEAQIWLGREEIELASCSKGKRKSTAKRVQTGCLFMAADYQEPLIRCKQHFHDWSRHSGEDVGICARRVAGVQLHSYRNRKRPHLHRSGQCREGDWEIFADLCNWIHYKTTSYYIKNNLIMSIIRGFLQVSCSKSSDCLGSELEVEAVPPIDLSSIHAWNRF